MSLDWHGALQAVVHHPLFGVGITLAVYQLAVDITFLNAGWGAMGRSGSTMIDANAFGIHDMHGNVAEWVEDCYAPNYQLAPIDGAALQSDECARRVHRGGGYVDQAVALRSAARQPAAPNLRSPSIGFRIARTLD